jgi:hypothetical protein
MPGGLFVSCLRVTSMVTSVEVDVRINGDGLRLLLGYRALCLGDDGPKQRPQYKGNRAFSHVTLPLDAAREPSPIPHATALLCQPWVLVV